MVGDRLPAGLLPWVSGWWVGLVGSGDPPTAPLDRAAEGGGGRWWGSPASWVHRALEETS